MLQVKNLSTSFEIAGVWQKVIHSVSFDVYPGETLGIIGESGCGKSVTSLSILRLIPKPWGKINSGEIYLQGKNLSVLSPKEFRKVRGRDISMIFQDPMTSLNPVLTIGTQIIEVIKLKGDLPPSQYKHRAIELLNEVGIADPKERLDAYAHELSGGMRQRVMIAMALASNPKVLIADEPTTALDVTIQAQILALLQGLQKKHKMALILITHDLGVVAQICDQVLVMYGGHVVEKAPVDHLFSQPKHPYTYGLIRSIKSLTQFKKRQLYTIPGQVPRLGQFGDGCVFYSRCFNRQIECAVTQPGLSPDKAPHQSACPIPFEQGKE